MWSIEYVQVPSEDRELGPKEDAKVSETSSKPLSIHNRLVKQVNISNESGLGGLMKSGSESSLSEENVTRVPSLDRQKSNECSSKEWRSEQQQDEKDTCSDVEESAPPIPTIRRRRSRVHGGFRKSEGTKFSYALFGKGR